MRNKILFILFIHLFFIVHKSSGQQFYCRNYTINDGLPDNCIHDLYKDSRGFLWIGTNAGIAKFDGKNFKIYSSQDGLAGNNARSISESYDGCIWVGFYDGGISKLNGEKIISYNSNNGLISDNIRKIYYSNKFKILLIGTEDGLSVFNDTSFVSFQKELNNVERRLQVTDFIEGDNFIYVFTNGSGFYKYIPESEKLVLLNALHPFDDIFTSSAYISETKDTLINFNRRNLKLIKNDVSKIFENVGHIYDYKEDTEHNIWIAAWSNNYLNAGGVYKYKNQDIKRFNPFLNIDSENVLSLEYDSKENLIWIGTQEDGLFLYPQSNFFYYKANDFSLSNLNVTDLHFDTARNLWIATKKNVIKKEPDGQFKIFSFNSFQKIFNEFLNKKIKSKYAYLNDKTGSFEKYEKLIASGKYQFANPYQKLKGNKSKKLPAKSLYKPLKYDIIINKRLTGLNSIKADKNDNIWVGSNVGMFKITKKTETITYYDLEGNYFSNFIFDTQNNFFGISWSDLFIYPDIEHNSNYSFYNYYEDKSPINISKIKTHNGKIWFVSQDHGLFIYDNSKFYSTYEQNIIKTQAFSDICFDQQENVIIGGINGNIYITHLEKDTIRIKYIINKLNGLLGSSIRWINCTEDNYLIAGTNAGLNIINLNNIYQTGVISVETLDKGRGFTDYSGKVSVIDKNGDIWIGTNNNLVKIELNKLKKYRNNYINFFIKSIEINDKFYNLKDLKNIDPWTNVPKSIIKLPYYKNSITFYYDVINYLDPDNITFSYKLEGFQDSWSKETKDRKAVFQNLKPGNYRLRIKVFNKSETETNQELAIGILIMAPFWAKWWVILSCVILLIFSIWLIIHIRTKNIKKRERFRAELSERITELEMKALRSQMNPHFIFNAINSIQNYMLDNDVDSALNYLSDFAKLIRLTLDNVSRKQVTLEEELNYLKYYLNLEQMRFDNKFETEFILPDDYEINKILVPPMIIQPYVENSIKHGFIYKNEGGKIKLEFQITEESILKCIIEDNGIGRKKSLELNKNSKTHKSRGTFITNERLSLLNQTQQKKGYKINTIDLYDENRFAVGTRVEIFIPI